MLADHLTFVDSFTRIDEKFTTILKVMQAISNGLALLHHNERTIDAAWYFTFIWLIFFKAVCDNGLTRCYVQQVIPQVQ